jgi:hypothetical protein
MRSHNHCCRAKAISITYSECVFVGLVIGWKITKPMSFLISNFRRVQNVVCFHLGNSLASEFYMLTFRKALFRLHKHTYLRMKMEQTECSETSVYKIQTPGNYPEENMQT